MKTLRVSRLNNLSPTLFRRLKAAQMEAARVTHAPWPGQRELEQATKGRFALNAQAVQQIVHAFLANVETTRTLRREHPEMRMKYPWREKRFYPVKWPAQAVHREKGRVVLPMGKGHPSLVLPIALPENAGAARRTRWQVIFQWRGVTIVLGRCVSMTSTGLTTQYIRYKKEDLSKRQMYGRAQFDLLRLRVLNVA